MADDKSTTTESSSQDGSENGDAGGGRGELPSQHLRHRTGQ